MGGGTRKNNLNNLGNNRRRTGPAFSNLMNDNDTDESLAPVTMSQVNSLVAKNDKAMQVLIDNYRRTGTNVPLWLSSAPYYKKDALLVVNLRDDKEILTFEIESPEEKKQRKEEPGKSAVKNERQTSPLPQPNKTFAVSGGDAASRLGLRIGPSADSAHQMKPTTILKNENKKSPVPAVKQPEMAFVGNVKNLMTFDSGLDALLGTNPATDPMSINSDPLWGTDSLAAPMPDIDDLQNVLTTLQNLAPSFDGPKMDILPISVAVIAAETGQESPVPLLTSSTAQITPPLAPSIQPAMSSSPSQQPQPQPQLQPQAQAAQAAALQAQQLMFLQQQQFAVAQQQQQQAAQQMGQAPSPQQQQQQQQLQQAAVNSSARRAVVSFTSGGAVPIDHQDYGSPSSNNFRRRSNSVTSGSRGGISGIAPQSPTTGRFSNTLNSSTKSPSLKPVDNNSANGNDGAALDTIQLDF
eukprot:GILI01019154.1.p1 GENE.GILI01019154.1~~GILI01019154.1.p1  ORF type:complete len:478 (+),score=90.80 GILI01019154.1:39-1436(+)